MNFTALLFSILLASSPSTFNTSTDHNANTDRIEESDFVVGVFVTFEDGTSELIEKVNVPCEMDYETINAQGEVEPDTKKLSRLLTTTKLESFQGKKIIASQSFFGAATCSNDSFRVFVLKCYGVITGFGNGCFIRNQRWCTCADPRNSYSSPCWERGCQNLFIWCNAS